MNRQGFMSLLGGVDRVAGGGAGQQDLPVAGDF